ncbi:MAG: 50S ribosomal protein L11 methyltransferase [Pseudomonadota bacterium]
MGFRQLVIDSSGSDPAPLEAFLEAHGALSITLTDAGDTPLLEPAPGATPLWPDVRITALFDDTADLDAMARSIRERASTALSVSVEAVPDRDWERAWLEDFRPQRFGERLWVCPRGQASGDPDAIELILDPGLAFGTGNHATTALCLTWLSRRVLAGASVIDYGSGSGILGIAALKLGAARVAATDIDPQALRATRDNAAVNGVETALTASPPAGFAPPPADVLLANILAGTLMDLGGSLAAFVKPGGHIALSGILADQADEVAALYTQWFDLRRPRVRDGWALLSGRRRART